MKPTLLLVEDDEVFARAITRALDLRGYAVDHTLNAEAAVRTMAEVKFDYAILDLNLGGHTSLSLIQPLRKANPEMRILMLTGYASIATAVEAIKLGADDYLAKPADTGDILNALLAERHEASPSPAEKAESILEPMSVRRLEWEHIQKVLAENDGNVSETARQLKMHRRTLQRKLQKRPVAS
jgi:two-component system response regulator RegA